MQPTIWYENPAWYAFAIAVFSLVVSLAVLSLQRRTIKLNLQRGLVQQAAAINESFIRYKVKSPFAHHLQIPDDRMEAFTGKTVLLLNQINLLRDVFDNRAQLGTGAVNGYKRWAATIVRPWIEADSDLCKVWELTRQSKDWQDAKFIVWLEEVFPIVARRSGV